MTEDKYARLRSLADGHWDLYHLHLWDKDEDSFDELCGDVRDLLSERDALVAEWDEAKYSAEHTKMKSSCPYCNGSGVQY